MVFGKGTIVAGALAFVAFTAAPQALLNHGNVRPEVSPPFAWLPFPIAVEAPTEGARPRRPQIWGGAGWCCVRYFSVYGVLIVEVETVQLHLAPTIAQRIIAPLQDDYIEVLVYFRRPGITFATTQV